MTIAYFDCFNGASGDMIVGALLAAGADLGRLREALRALPIEGIEIRTRGLERQGITATKFDVVVRGAIEAPAEEAHSHDHGHAHNHDHEHTHEHEHRTLGDVEAVLSHLPPRPRERATAIFRRLAEAEAKVHGTTAPFVHFHEVGMDDAIIDVAAAVLCLEQLGVTEIHCSPLPLGSGMIRCAHGTMPVPVPAVVELMAGFPSYDNGETGELTTPTGAAILTALADRFGPPPPWSISAVGYGGGAREGKRVPNLLRVMIGQAAARPTSELSEIQANLDDMNPQLYGPLVDRLLAAGALDVTLTPTIMKKGRPGIVLAALAPVASRAAVSEAIFQETTTLGLRYHAVARTELTRETRSVETPWGSVTVKVGKLDGRVVNAMPEFEEVRRLAESAGRPVKEVWQAAVGAAGGPW